MNKVILHIGTEKTGTTTIQEFFSTNRNSLEKMNFFYPKSLGFKNHIRLPVYAANTNRGFSQKIINNFDNLHLFKKTIIDDFYKEINIYKPKTIICSSEHLHSQLKTFEELYKLKDFFQTDNFHIILYIRRQDRIAVSLASTALKAGFLNNSFFPIINNERLPYRYDYLHCYKLWSKVFGSHAITVRIFNDQEFTGGHLIKDICATIGIPWDNSFKIPINQNKSLDLNGQFIVNKINEYKNINSNLADSNAKRLISKISDHFINDTKILPARWEAEDFYMNFISSNDELKKIVFPNRKKNLFDVNFSEYPIHKEPILISPDYNKIITFLLDNIMQNKD